VPSGICREIEATGEGGLIASSTLLLVAGPRLVMVITKRRVSKDEVKSWLTVCVTPRFAGARTFVVTSKLLTRNNWLALVRKARRSLPQRMRFEGVPWTLATACVPRGWRLPISKAIPLAF